MRANASIITPPHELLEQPRFAPEHIEPDNPTVPAAQAAEGSQLPTTIPAPTPGNALDALKLIHTHSRASAGGILWIARWFHQRDQNPLYKPYILTAAQPVVLDRAQGQAARSITVLVPGLAGVANAVFCVGIGGRSATAAAGAFVIPSLYATIPLQADDVQIGFDPASGQPAGDIPIFVLRWATVQPFAAR